MFIIKQNKGDIKMKSKEYFNLLQDIIILCTSNKDYTINIKFLLIFSFHNYQSPLFI